MRTNNTGRQIDLEASIFIEETFGLARVDEPVRIGVPLPKGFVSDVNMLGVKNEGGLDIPLQARSLAGWPDGSIKWVLLDFVSSEERSARRTYKLGRLTDRDASRRSGGGGFILRDEDEWLVVDTGAAQFCISRTHLAPFRCVNLGNLPFLSGQGSRVEMIDEGGTVYIPEIYGFVEEEKGPVRLTFRIDGRFLAQGRNCLCLFRSRLTFYHGLAIVRMEFQIHNPRSAIHPGGLWDLGDKGSIRFRDLSVVFHASEMPYSISWVAENNGCISEQEEPRWLLYQDSSGGINWNSPNHVERNGKTTVSFRGFRVAREKSGLKSAMASGDRATPYVQVNTSSGWMAATVDAFWQNFPKALRISEDNLSLGLFPEESEKGFELQGGEKKRHVAFLDFGLPERKTVIPQLLNPLNVWVDPRWVENTKAIPNFSVLTDEADQTVLKYITNVVEGTNSFLNKRELGDEYGWRNFGDLYADHEAIGAKSSGSFISHYNNQYDFIYGGLLQYLRAGDRRWFLMAEQAARHTIDIDIYHTDEDKPAYNHGFFWHTDHYKDAGTCTHRTYSRKNGTGTGYGGGPGNEHNYTSGLLHYHYITGDSEGADAVIELANWVIGMDDGSKNILGIIDEGPTGLASSTAVREYHKPGRGSGNSINALLDAYTLSNRRHYMIKAEELIQRCIHPEDDIPSLKLDEPEYRWSYLVFLQVLGKYLDKKVDLAEADYPFFYARDSLLHYVDWMIDHEVPYKDVLHKLEIPSETWSAQDVRKCHIFHLAAKYGPREQRSAYEEKATFFFDRCLQDLLSFKTSYLTRPLVILTVYGPVHSYFQKHSQSDLPFRSHGYNFETPPQWVPQRFRVSRSLRAKGRLVAKEFRRFSVAQWQSYKNRITNKK
jgi:hypothetical protein